VTLPFLVGFGYESYKATLDKKDFGGKADLNFAIFDIFFNLPISVVNIAIGGGFGTATFDPSTVDLGAGNTLKASSAPITQYFASVGWPFAAIFDVHLGYHVISGKYDAKATIGGVTAKTSASLKANMTSLGAKVAF
jgi:hypothetical protein